MLLPIAKATVENICYHHSAPGVVFMLVVSGPHAATTSGSGLIPASMTKVLDVASCPLYVYRLYLDKKKAHR
jgi:hypothetical protein